MDYNWRKMVRQMNHVWLIRIKINNLHLSLQKDNTANFKDFFDIYYDKSSKMWSMVEHRENLQKLEIYKRKRAAKVLQKWFSKKLDSWYNLMKNVLEMKRINGPS